MVLLIANFQSFSGTIFPAEKMTCEYEQNGF